MNFKTYGFRPTLMYSRHTNKCPSYGHRWRLL